LPARFAEDSTNLQSTDRQGSDFQSTDVLALDVQASNFQGRDLAEEPTHLFKLFVSGADTMATEKMLRVLRNTLESTLSRPYTLHLIDVITHPDEAESNNITATPTLIQVSPPPVRRIVGYWPSPQQLRDLLGA
jgi:circadian clock protein KaiB